MPFTVTASPAQAFVNAFKARAEADAPLMAMITGIYGRLPEATRTPYPYLVFGQETREGNAIDAGALGLAGARVTVQLDGWSDYKGKSQIRSIFSRVLVLFERKPLAVAGFGLMENSVTCEFETIDDEADLDSPELKLEHGIQRWTCVLDEVL
jgi:hypothetical protein